MKPREIVKKRREELGYTQTQLEDKMGKHSTCFPCLEVDDDELEYNTSVGGIRKLSSTLGIPILCLLNEACPVCKQQSNDIEDDIDISKLIKKKREEKGFSVTELGDLAGVYDQVIAKIEESHEGIDELNAVMLKDLSKALDIPLLTLLGRKCAVCEKTKET